MGTDVNTGRAAFDSTLDKGGIGGHPRGLTTLFFTEMWERFSYYGMRALLILYMTAPLTLGGLGFDEKRAAHIYGLYTSSVYLTPLIGGWIADRFLGAKRATLIGGIIIALGHFSMAIKSMPNFYGGLILIAIGTGFLKSNVNVMVGELYDKNDMRRDAGFSIFYMGINLGGFIAPIICGVLGQKFDWHYGFAAAGVGMVFGILQYVFSGDRLKNIGLPPSQRKLEETEENASDSNNQSSFSPIYILSLVAIVLLSIASVYLLGTPLMPTLLVAGLIAVLLTGMQDKLTVDEWKRLAMIFILFCFSCLFWAGFEQTGSSLNLFADRLTDLSLPLWMTQAAANIPFIGNYMGNALAGGIPSSWFQSINALFIIAFAPVLAWLWIRLGKGQPSDPIKFSLGLLFLGLGFVVIAYASSLTGAGKVAKGWLITVYLFHTIGELCLSPVGLSAMTKLAPLKMAGLMMGVWFLSLSMGNYIAGQIAGEFKPTEDVLVGLFSNVAIAVIAGAVLLAALSPLIKKLLDRAD